MIFWDKKQIKSPEKKVSQLIKCHIKPQAQSVVPGKQLFALANAQTKVSDVRVKEKNQSLKKREQIPKSQINCFDLN